MSCAIEQLNKTKRRKGGGKWVMDMIKCREPCDMECGKCKTCKNACPDDCSEHMDSKLFKCPVCTGNESALFDNQSTVSTFKKTFTVRSGKNLIKSPHGEDSYVFDRDNQQQFTLKKGMYLEGYAFAKKEDYRFDTLEAAQRAILGSKRKRIGGITVEKIAIADGFSSD